MVFNISLFVFLDVVLCKVWFRMSNIKGTKRSGGIIASSIAVSAFVVFTKVIGFLKQAVIAAYFGATDQTDAFFLTSGFVMSFGMMVFSSLSVTLLAMYVREKEKGQPLADMLVSSAIKLFVPLSATLAIILCLFSGPLAFVLAPAYDAGKLEVVSHYLKLLCVVVFLYCPYLILNSVLEANKVFLAGRMLALFQSLLLIIAAIFFSVSGDALVLVIAFAMASLVNLIYIALRARTYYRFRKNAALFNNKIRTLASLMLPVLLGNAVLEVNSIIERGVASALDTGSVSALTYGWSVYEIVTGVIVSAISAVLFSYFAGFLAKNDTKGMARCLEKCVSTLALVLAPATVFTILCADDIVTILYFRGSFGEDARAATALVISTYAIGFVPTSVRSVLTKAHYAFQDSKSPMVNGFITVACGGLGSILLAIVLGMGISGIGIAVSVSMFLSAVMYQYTISKRLPECKMSKTKTLFAVKIAISTVVSFIAGWMIRQALTEVRFAAPIFGASANLLMVFVVCFALFFGVIWILRVKELAYLTALFPKSIRREKER